MKKRLLLLATTVTAMVSAFSIRNIDNVIMSALAESSKYTSEADYTATELNWGSQSAWGGPIYWHSNTLDPLPTWEELNFYTSNTSEDYTLYNSSYQEGEYIFDSIYDELDETMQNRIASLGYTVSNLNYYGTTDYGIDIAFGLESSVLTTLVDLANAANAEFKLPYLMLEDEAFALLDVTKTGVKVLTVNQFVSSVEQVYEHVVEVSMTSAGDPGDRVARDVTNILFHIKPHTIGKISEIQCLSDITNHLGTQVTFFPKNQQCILPYDIQHFNFESGEIILGHSIYNDYYGQMEQTKRLSSITFEVYAMGERKTYTSTALSQSEYQDYLVNGSYTEEQKKEILKNRFTYAPRGAYDWENATGSGGLIWQNYFPYKPYDVTLNSEVKILAVSFIDSHENSIFVEAGDVETAYSLPDGAFKYAVYVDKCTARGHIDMDERSIGTGGRVVKTNWWLFALNFFIPVTGGPVGYLAGNQVIQNILNRGLNIQRFYFNFYDQQKELLSRINKIEFKYQMGKQDIIKSYNDDGTLDVQYDASLPILVARKEKTDTTSSADFLWMDIEYEGNGFVSCEEDPVELTGEDGHTELYNYYYQNVYHTKDTDSGKAYFDHICYYTVLSFWYDTYEGQTVRLTTDYDGYYLTTGFDGKEVVMNIADPENPTTMTKNEFLTRTADQDTHNYDPGSPNDGDKHIEDITKWWNNISNSVKDNWDNIKRIVAIAAICVGGVLALGITLRLLGFLGKSANSFKSGTKRKKKDK